MKTFLFVFLTLSLLACGTAKNKNTAGIHEITFGSGGGFTGEVKTYVLHDDGNVTVEDSVIFHVNNEDKQHLFNSAASIKDSSVNSPGNMYYFVEWISKEGNQKYLWSSSTQVSSAVNKLYKELNSLLK